jgi:hypothetical protein
VASSGRANGKRDLAGQPGSVNLRFELWICRALKAQKGSPAKGPGKPLCVAAQYIQKTSKNNGLFADWLAENSGKTGLPT